MKIQDEEPILIKWKISAEERRSQNPPNRKEIVIELRKKARATKESRAKSKHLRDKCCCDEHLCPFMLSYLASKNY